MGIPKTIFTAILTGLLIVGFQIGASAQEKSNPPEKGNIQEKPDFQNRRLEMMKDRLKLSDGQVNEIKAIMETARLKAEKDREKFREAGDRDGARKAAEARQKETQEKIKSVLNDKQKKDYVKMLKDRQDRRGRRGDRRDQAPGGKKGRGAGNWR